jgi:hypothetical protein
LSPQRRRWISSAGDDLFSRAPPLPNSAGDRANKVEGLARYAGPLQFLIDCADRGGVFKARSEPWIMQARQHTVQDSPSDPVRLPSPIRASRVAMKAPQRRVSLPELGRVGRRLCHGEGLVQRLLGVVVAEPRQLDLTLEPVGPGQVFPRAGAGGDLETTIGKASRPRWVPAAQPDLAEAREEASSSATSATR